jgi:small subunit ribosomal protein S16
MSVRIRFNRQGRPHDPFFQIVAIDRQRSRDDKPIEILGTINPRKASKIEVLNADRVKYWLSVGALATPSVVHALKVNKLWDQVKPTAPAKN